MSGEPKVCPILLEFAGWPGMPEAPIREERYSFNLEDRADCFRKHLDHVTSAGIEAPVQLFRFAAALTAVSLCSYDPAPLPEPAPAAGGAE